MFIKRLNRDFELLDKPIAHKGIYGVNKNMTIRENSLESIQLAIDKKIPFEFDIHKTKDNIPVIYHDFNITIDNVNYTIRKFTLQEIRKLTKDIIYIPTLQEIVDLNKNLKVPMLLDFKDTSFLFLNKYRRNIVTILKNYEGEYAIEAFNPFFVFRMGFALPKALTGQLICRGKTLVDCFNVKKHTSIGTIYEKLQSLICFIANSDFIAMEINNSTDWNFIIEKNLANNIDKIQNLLVEITSITTKKPVIGWTYTKPEDIKNSSHLFKNYIFDTPNNNLDEYDKIFKSLSN